MKGTRRVRIKKNIPNLITTLRIAGALSIPFLPTLKPLFFTVYALTGVTDIFDGFLARKMGIASEFGARLDSIADLLFYTLTIVKLLPVLWEKLPRVIWFFVGLVLAVRLFSYLVAAIKFRRFASHHTWLNKITGAFVFAIPFFLVTPAASPFCFSACFIGLLSSFEELYIHLSSSSYNEKVKSAFVKQ